MLESFQFVALELARAEVFGKSLSLNISDALCFRVAAHRDPAAWV